jgi:hypothetical protein
MKSDISKTGIFKYLSKRIFHRKFLHHASRRSDELPARKIFFKRKVLPAPVPQAQVICCWYSASRAKSLMNSKKQVVSQHHQLEDRFIDPK